MVSALSGNISVKIGEEGMIITPSGIHRAFLRPEDLVVLRFDGKVLEGSGLKPSSEWRMHAEIYRVRDDVRAIVHAHVPYTMALTLAGIEISGLAEIEAIFREGLSYAPYRPPGSVELANIVSKIASKTRCKVIILENHGAVALGKSPTEAEALLEALEEISRILFLKTTLKGMIENIHNRGST